MLRNPDETLWRQVKAQAALDGVTLTQWVEEAIKIRLAKGRNE
jgi:predicted HicB family RNase H-like nuclease